MCARCFKANRDCSWASLRYQAALDRRLTALRNAARGARTATRWTAHRTRRSRRPAANAEAGPSSQRLSSIEWDAHLDPSGPTFELLYGGSSSSSEFHNAHCVVLMWRSELSRAEGAVLAANRHLVFTHQALTEALGQCYTASPSAGGSQSGPSSASSNKGKGKGRADDGSLVRGRAVLTLLRS